QRDPRRWNGSACQADQRQYQSGAIFGAFGREPARPDCCHAESFHAHAGMAFGSFGGRADGRTTTGCDGALSVPAASSAPTRYTLGPARWKPVIRERRSPGASDATVARLESVTW